MSDKSSSSNNPFFDAWWAGSEQLMSAQTEWFSNLPFSNASDDSNIFFENIKQNWEKCEEQYGAWLSASDEWFKEFEGATNQEKDFTKSFESLKSNLNPMSFLNSGIGEFDRVFQKLVDGPDFADFGVYEKKFLRINKAWEASQAASADYQTIISSAWAQAFNEFTAYVSEHENKNAIDPKDLLQKWMKIANKSLIQMQRSDAYLDVQNKLVDTHTQFRLQQKELTETWCEAMLIPSRSEVDDLHKTVYELKREVRTLKRQLKSDKKITEQKPVSVPVIKKEDKKTQPEQVKQQTKTKKKAAVKKKPISKKNEKTLLTSKSVKPAKQKKSA